MPKKIGANPKAEAARVREAESKAKANVAKAKAAEDAEWFACTTPQQNDRFALAQSATQLCPARLSQGGR